MCRLERSSWLEWLRFLEFIQNRFYDKHAYRYRGNRDYFHNSWVNYDRISLSPVLIWLRRRKLGAVYATCLPLPCGIRPLITWLGLPCMAHMALKPRATSLVLHGATGLQQARFCWWQVCMINRFHSISLVGLCMIVAHIFWHCLLWYYPRWS